MSVAYTVGSNVSNDYRTNGDNNDVPVIQAAIDAASVAGGGTVTLQSGQVFRHYSGSTLVQLDVKENVTVIATGAIYRPYTNISNYSIYGTMILLLRTNSKWFGGTFNIDANSPIDASSTIPLGFTVCGYGVFAIGGTNSELANTNISYFRGAGTVQNSYSATTNVDIHDNYSTYIQGGFQTIWYGYDMNDVRIHDNTFYNVTDDCVDLAITSNTANLTNFQFYNNHIEITDAWVAAGHNSARGILIYGAYTQEGIDPSKYAESVLIYNNYIYGTTFSGIRLSGRTRGSKIYNNTLVKCGRYAGPDDTGDSRHSGILCLSYTYAGQNTANIIDTQIYNNIISNCNRGITVDFPGNSIEANTITNVTYPTTIVAGNYTKVFNNLPFPSRMQVA